MRQEATTAPHVLNSWKEISAFLGRGVRTVQRWERPYKLPVYRVGKGQRSPVFAYSSELSLWLHHISRHQINQVSRNQIPQNQLSQDNVPQNQLSQRNEHIHLEPDSVNRVEAQRLAHPHATLELVGHSSRLTQNLLFLTAQHQQRAAALMQTVDNLSARLPVIAHHFRGRRNRTPLRQNSAGKSQPGLAGDVLPLTALPRKPKVLSPPTSAR